MVSCFYLKFVLAAIGCVVLIVGGALVHTEIPRYVKKRVKEAFIMNTPTSESFSQFVDPAKTANVYNTYYMFNYTNVEGMLNRGEKPVLDQLGPYTYLKVSYKELDTLSWNANGTINYKYHDSYEFVPEMSVGTENDTLATVNLGYVGLLDTVAKVDPKLCPIIITVLGKSMPMINLTVYQMLWGYENPILEFVDSIAVFLKQPPPVPSRIALQQQNDPTTWLNFSQAYTGGDAAEGLPTPPSNSILTLTRWAGYEVLPYWNSSYANMVNGTDGTSFMPGYLTNGPDVPVFVDSIFRSVYLSTANSLKYRGVDLISLQLSRSELLDMYHNPNNAAFNMVTSGFIPYPPALKEPVYISLPHFLYANFSAPDVNVTYLQNEGESKYTIRLNVEPITGQLFVANKRLQVNTYLKPNINFPNNTVNTFAPLIYIDQNFEIPDNLFQKYRNQVQMPIQIGYWGGIAFIVVGSIGLVATAVVTVLCIRKRIRSAESELYDPLN